MTTPVEAFGALVDQRGIGARPLGLLIQQLSGEGAGFDDLVRGTALPRRVVEAALAALGPDVEEAEPGARPRLRLRPDRVAAYSSFASLGPAHAGGEVPPGLLATVREAIEAAPRPKRELDHVAATPETVARRAAWLARTFALSGRRVLCVGDHDLTSVALAALDPTIDVAVADMDEDVLAHVATWRAAGPGAGARVRALFADFRLGLPARLRGGADLVVTDPPYTPEGVALFARRGLEALADHGTGRLVVAYGYGDQPGLGLNVQEALARLKLTYEAVLPAFNRYDGAQAVGSASNLYVLRPTAGTRKVLAAADRAPAPANVYTHGPQSSEGGTRPPEPGELAALMSAGTHERRQIPPTLAVGDAWPSDGWPPGPVPRPVPLAACLAPESPESSPCSAPSLAEAAVVADLRHDAGPLLLRLLLATRAERIAVLVRNDHPDIADAAGQEALSTLVGDTLALRYRRSHPGPRLAIVEATRTTAPDPASAPAAAARRHVLDRPHATLANACREALIRATAPGRNRPLTKNEARGLVAEHVTAAGIDTSLALLEVPRAQLVALRGALAAAATV